MNWNMNEKEKEESSRNSLMVASEAECSSSSSFSSAGESEKKAISEPEAKPETNKSRHAMIPEMTAPNEGVRSVTSLNICRKLSIG